jgi:hypothetical protein
MIESVLMKTISRLLQLLFSLGLVVSLLTPSRVFAEHKLKVFTTGELGMLVPASHTIQFDKAGTVFNYIEDGGQDNAFVFARLQAEIKVQKKHSVIFLYQPLNLDTKVYLNEDVIVDEATFAADTSLDLRYGFDFYRASYLYHSKRNKRGDELSFGGSIQLRNATIDFNSGDGSLRRSNRDLGIVPLFKFRWKKSMADSTWLGAEMDGMYAPVKYINGSDSDVVGAIIDLSLRYGIPLDQHKDLFFNLRWIGGGAEGTSSDNQGPGDGFTANWLNFVSFSLGLTWEATGGLN